jgi:hypothetical protein
LAGAGGAQPTNQHEQTELEVVMDSLFVEVGKVVKTFHNSTSSPHALAWLVKVGTLSEQSVPKCHGIGLVFNHTKSKESMRPAALVYQGYYLVNTK